MCCTPLDLFFSVKQKTAYELRMSDWSSDVCSSDLASPTAISSCSATGSRAAQATHMAGRSGLPRADPLDVGADGLEFLLKPLVTAVEMRSAERRVWQEAVSTCRSRRSPYN